MWAVGNFFTPADRTTSGCTAASATATTLTIAGSCSITAADVGSYISSGTIFKAATTITAVAGSTVTLSQAVNAAVVSGDNLAIGIGKPLIGGVFAAGELSGGTGHTFAATDLGKVVTGANIPQGTIITAVNAATNKVTLSKAPTGAVTNPRLFNTSPIPSGVYTVTVVSNGSVGGQTAAGYAQSYHQRFDLHGRGLQLVSGSQLRQTTAARLPTGAGPSGFSWFPHGVRRPADG